MKKLWPTHDFHDFVNFHEKYEQKSIMYHVCTKKKRGKKANPPTLFFPLLRKTNNFLGLTQVSTQPTPHFNLQHHKNVSFSWAKVYWFWLNFDMIFEGFPDFGDIF